MSKKIIFALFVCLATVQIVIPASIIKKWENTLSQGRQYRFRTAPVDPYDPFRGRYVALSIKDNSVQAPKGESFRPGDPVFAIIEEDEESFARFSTITRTCPQGDNYIHAKVRGADRSKVSLKLPFDRYYAEEKIAPSIENAYRRHSRREKQDAFITVRVKSGFAVLEELYIKGIPVLEFVRKEFEKEG